MFERFTDRAKRAADDLAYAEAQLLGHNYIGTEHLLLGMIHEGDGIAAAALGSLGVSLEAVREQVQDIVGQGAHSSSGRLPYTPRGRKVLELTFHEAQQLGHSYIGTEHLLLGIVRQGDGVAVQVLVKLGVDLGYVRKAVLQALADRGAALYVPDTEPRVTQTVDVCFDNGVCVTLRGLPAGEAFTPTLHDTVDLLGEQVARME